ncbi:TetR/AcrR family transcriptional regulator [Nocardiopsis composta]|uniref:AcrR family transcriptional regulator n=1 Tax=Nocardiopsis composta TaxID=157465 RepID=A0A7W8QR14_9ACTN|nr:TetR family transcriptional regulator [Nocardiopsis composta]MBB5434836.1 AcrR family transcriptional regulator [Nocardiopsis composta]
MTARTDHPGPPRTGGVRERLLDAAYGAVVAGGWSRMRMADIARSAAVSRQTLYNEFGTKEGLLQAVVLREADRFLDGVEHILGEHGGAPADAVAAAARWTLAATAEDPLLRAVIAGDDELLPVLTTRAEPLHVALEQRINAYLSRRHPGLGRRGEAMTEVAVRLSLSYVLLPTDPERAAERIVAAVAGIAAAPRPAG